MTIFLLVLLVVVAITISFKTLLNTSAFRIFLVLHEKNMEEKEARKEAERERGKLLEEVKNPNKILDLILKIKKGEEVKIPLAAFNYIYQNLDNFTVVGRDGKLTILDEKSYFKFKEKATELLNKSEEVEIDVNEIIEQEKGRKPTTPIEIVEHEDGTIVKADHVNSTREIIRPNGDIIFVDLKNDSMVMEKVEDIDDENLSKKELAIKKQKEEMEQQKQNQKIKLLEKENREKEQQIKELEKIANNLENGNIPEEKIEEKQEGKQEKSVEKQEEKAVVEPIIRPKIKEKNSFIKRKVNLSKITKNSKIDDKPEITNVVNDIKQNEVKTTNSVNIEFKDFESFIEQITHKNIIKIIDYMLNIKLKIDLPLLVFEEDTNCILINLNYFTHKIYMAIESENERETFLFEFYKNVKKSVVDNLLLGKIIEKINQSSTFKLGFNILFQEKKDGNMINFKTVKIRTKEDVLYQGVYLYFFLNNSFGKKFKESKDFQIIVSNNFTVVDSKDTGEKIYFNDILEAKK